jgi:CoA:oxalate CoA-transferase
VFAAHGWVAIAAPEDAFARGVFEAIERADLLTDDRFGTRDDRVQNAIELHQSIEEWTARHSMAEAVARLQANGVPSAPVRPPAEALRDPGLHARGDLAELRHPRYGGADGVTRGGLPIHLSHVDAGFSPRVPELGEDNDSVYRGLLGNDDRLLTELRKQGVV